MATRQLKLEIETLESRQLLSAAAVLASEPTEYCVQYQETDFAFVSRLMEEEGLYYSSEHSHSAPEVQPGKYTLWDHCFELPQQLGAGAGEEVIADKYGRVKVQFHWDRQDTDSADSSCWIRVSQAWAGKCWGASFLPRIGQEVIVDFQEGDPDQPIIVGSVYNAETMPPYELPENKVQSGIKSNTSPGGGDSIWMDLGAPVLQTADGRKFKMLFAPLVVDLDDRVNVNVHGDAASEQLPRS